MATVNEKMTAIADSIRAKTGGTEKLNLDQMASAVGEVYEAGKKAEREAFLDKYQENGNRSNYNCAFAGVGWNNETFRLNHDLSITQSQYMFFNSGIIGDLCDLLSQMGKTLYFKQQKESINVSSMFAYTKFTRIPELNFVNVNGTTVFGNSKNIVTIDRLIVSENTTYNYWFNGCSELVNITFEGAIGQNGLNFKDCKKLNKASFESIVRAYSTTIEGLSCTFSEQARAAAFTDEEWEALRAERPKVTFYFV